MPSKVLDQINWLFFSTAPHASGGNARDIGGAAAAGSSGVGGGGECKIHLQTLPVYLVNSYDSDLLPMV